MAKYKKTKNNRWKIEVQSKSYLSAFKTKCKLKGSALHKGLLLLRGPGFKSCHLQTICLVARMELYQKALNQERGACVVVHF
jgi:hypothetical protein